MSKKQYICFPHTYDFFNLNKNEYIVAKKSTFVTKFSSNDSYNMCNSLPHNFQRRKKKPFENIVGKGENAGFSTISKTEIMLSTLNLSSANAFNLD